MCSQLTVYLLVRLQGARSLLTRCLGFGFTLRSLPAIRCLEHSSWSANEFLIKLERKQLRGCKEASFGHPGSSHPHLHTHTETDTHTQRHTQIDAHKDRHIYTHKHKDIQKDTHRQTCSDTQYRQVLTHTLKDIQTHREDRHTETHRETHGHTD